MACYPWRAKPVLRRCPEPKQYAGCAFGKRCHEMGVMPSIDSVGDAYDNAMAESFFATLERSCSIGVGSSRRPKPGSRSSSGSRAGTTCIGVTRRSGVSHRSTSKGDISPRKRHSRKAKTRPLKRVKSRSRISL